MSLERSELKIISVDEWVKEGRRPPKGVRAHNRLAKAVNADTPFHKLLALQEEQRAKRIQVEQAFTAAKVQAKAAEEQKRVSDRMSYLSNGIHSWDYSRSGSVKSPEQYAEFKLELGLWNWSIYPEERYSLTDRIYGLFDRLA